MPHVTGDLVLPWSTNGERALDGSARVVKVSLKTGDEVTARGRWPHVHAQVEALVQLGRLMVQEQAERERSRKTGARLPPDAIPTIAGQARHDLLAEHDRTWIDPTFTSPLTSVVVGLMRKAGAASAAKTREAAQRFADDLLLREAKGNLSKRDTGLLDVEITEAELDPDPALIDIDALRGGQVSALTPAQLDHLDIPATFGCR